MGEEDDTGASAGVSAEEAWKAFCKARLPGNEERAFRAIVDGLVESARREEKLRALRCVDYEIGAAKKRDEWYGQLKWVRKAIDRGDHALPSSPPSEHRPRNTGRREAMRDRMSSVLSAQIFDGKSYTEAHLEAPPYRDILCKKCADVVLEKRKRWWVSWYSKGSFSLESPWWIERHDSPDTLEVKFLAFAAVVAPDEDAARKVVLDAHHEERPKVMWRFVLQQPSTWSPFSDRFPRQDWMKW